MFPTQIVWPMIQILGAAAILAVAILATLTVVAAFLRERVSVAPTASQQAENFKKYRNNKKGRYGMSYEKNEVSTKVVYPRFEEEDMKAVLQLEVVNRVAIERQPEPYKDTDGNDTDEAQFYLTLGDDKFQLNYDQVDELADMLRNVINRDDEIKKRVLVFTRLIKKEK